MPQGRAVSVGSVVVLEAQGTVAGNRCNLFRQRPQASRQRLDPRTVRSVSPAARPATPPTSALSPNRSRSTAAKWTRGRLHLLPNQFDRHNVAIAPVIGGGTPLALQTGGKNQRALHRGHHPGRRQEQRRGGLTALAGGGTNTPVKTFSLWQTGMVLVFAGAYFGFDAAAAADPPGKWFWAVSGMLGSWGSSLRSPSRPGAGGGRGAARFRRTGDLEFGRAGRPPRPGQSGSDAGLARGSIRGN